METPLSPLSFVRRARRLADARFFERVDRFSSALHRLEVRTAPGKTQKYVLRGRRPAIARQEDWTRNSGETPMSMQTMKSIPAAVSSQVSPEEWQIRVDLAACYRLIALYGWDDLIFTHISTKVPGPERHFLINPYGMLFEEITASSLVKIDQEGAPVLPSPFPVNPAGFVIHGAIHEGRADAQCVLHLHTPHGQAVAAQKQGLLPITQTAMALHGDIAYHDFEGIATDLDERARLVSDLGAKHTMILRNHGTLTIGATVAEAFLRMYFLERACEAQVLAQAGGVGLNPAPPGTPEKTARQVGHSGRVIARELAWPGLLRRLDRRDPSYRQ